jgi:hypothetical protein
LRGESTWALLLHELPVSLERQLDFPLSHSRECCGSCFGNSSPRTTEDALAATYTQMDHYYVAYLKDDPAKEPIAPSYSAPGMLAEAAHNTGRVKGRF